MARIGESPYAADYSQTLLGRQARVSDFWSERGGNPILRHHAYLPGTHLIMLPAYLALRPAGLFGISPIVRMPMACRYDASASPSCSDSIATCQ